MLISVDIGNSVVKCAVYDLPSLDAVARFRIAAIPVRSADEYRVLFGQFLSENCLEDKIDAAVISSVVPTLTAPIYSAARDISGTKPFMIGAGTHTGFRISIDVHSQLGADIVSNVAAAKLTLTPPMAIVDLGTATTIAAVDVGGNLIGAIIHPGLQISLDALSHSAALLSDVPLMKPNSLIGQNSTTSIQSGLIYGHIAMINGLLDQLTDALCKNGESLSMVATGGHADAVIPYCKHPMEIVPDLTVRGAASLFALNRKNR